MQLGSPPPPLIANEKSNLFSLPGRIPPRRIPATYRLTLALSAFALILLPLIYIGLILAAAWAVWLYAIYGLSIFQSSGGGIWKVILYLGPLVAGAILIVFMVKPIFARRAHSVDPLEIDLEQEPVLRDLIRDICIQIRAPMPSMVNVDCQVNASARLRRGWISLGRRDLALTIGLPLAANLTARQLAVVLAHEFGHFAQGGGMALTYVIRSINGWFARVVFERDQWDEALEESSQKSDVRIAVILHLARGAVWVSRKILHGLMYVGHVITCLQLRQMEYDADYYETHVAGSDDFIQTSQELARLGMTNNTVIGELAELWNQRRLVNDFPGFVAFRRSQLSTENAVQITSAQLEKRTHWLDTHPSDHDRITQAKSLNQSGLFLGEGPAALLFRDFPNLCKEATQYYYREQLELTFEDNALVPVAAAARASEENNAPDAARVRLAGPVLNLNRPLVWQESDFASTDISLDARQIQNQLAATRTELNRLRADAEKAESRYVVLREDLENVLGAKALLLEGVTIKPSSFNLPQSDLAAAETRLAELAIQISDRTRELAAFEATVRAWVVLVVRAARLPEVAAALPTGQAERIGGWANSLAALKPWFLAFPEWLNVHNIFTLYASNARSLSSNDRFMRGLDLKRMESRSLPKQAREMINQIPHPFADADEVTTIDAALDKALIGVDLDGRAPVLLRLTIRFYFRIVGHLVLAGEEIEKLLASLPLPAPPSSQCQQPTIPSEAPAPSS